MHNPISSARNVLKWIFIMQLLFIILIRNSNAQNELNVITGKWLEYSCARNSLYNHLTDQAYEQLEEREGKIIKIESLTGWKERQDFIRKKLMDCTGPFLEKAPLNATITRKIVKNDFTVEHIIFESVPGFYVTSSLYRPSGTGRNAKLPAVIYCSGHSEDGYRSDVYQHVILNLVKKGFIVFAFDPVGQGERLEYFDPGTGKSVIGGPTSEHSYPGAQAFLTGSSQARYMIWDGIRAVDYLLTRKEVDPSRIGITGRSGGGTQSAYIAAYDERIYAAAPENYITNYKRLLQSIGPQDAEQNLFNVISEGLDHPDFLIVRAPKPALMITTTGDMFSIQGAMETEQEVGRIYKAYGKAENFSRCEDDAAHASTKKNRESMYAFFQKHLNNPGNPADEEVAPLTKDEMRVTATGQISTSLGGETVFSLNLKEAVKLEEKNPAKADIISSAKKLSGYMEPSTDDKPVFAGRIIRNGYSIDKFFVKGEGEYVLPYLFFRPVKPSGRAMIYLHPDGKAAEAKDGGEIEQIVKQGFIVLAPDLAGTGELGPGDFRGDAYFKGASHNLWYASMLVGRSITGVQAGDVTKLALLLKRDEDVAEVTGFARQGMVPVLLHSALLSDAIGSMILVNPYSSFIAVAAERFYNPFFIMSCVPGALKKYDLPYLEASFAPRRLVIAGSVDGKNTTAGQAIIDKDLNIVKASYKKAGSEDKLRILTEGNPDISALSEWMK